MDFFINAFIGFGIGIIVGLAGDDCLDRWGILLRDRLEKKKAKHIKQ